MEIDHDATIARLLIAKPNATLTDIRRLVPTVAAMNDRDLNQKVEFLRRSKMRAIKPKTGGFKQ
ncbi:hypothetical protein [Pelagibacterium montanilacus]|uniref:hypothetical protein n=1 Tax=Pelagibacterium montanilacus TaxID=2185280 RepID=UPI000F8C4E75|nr:hypothetical protein [Pelagibacterium montanilacus]